jgi:L-ascorbate metabolism protein UlaG (beta-lactamase superfamily)
MSKTIDIERRAIILAAGVAPLIAAAAHGATHDTGTTAIKIQRLAWAGVKLELDDTAIFIDARAPNADDDAPGPELASTASRRFAFVTHHHSDHCDPVALKPILGEHDYLVSNDEVARFFDNRIVNVQPARLHEPVFVSRSNGAFVARCVPASDGLGSPQVSWVLEGGGKRIIHCGDTLWHGGWWDIARAYGPFDLAFLPINGFHQIGDRYTDSGQVMSMTPEQAVSAARILQARLVVPIHYGAHRSAEYFEEPHPLDRFTRAATTAGLQSRAMKPGDIFTL